MSGRTAFHLALLGVGAYMTHRSSTAPTPPPNENEVKHDATPKEKFFGQFARRIGGAIKYATWANAGCTAAVLVARDYQSKWGTTVLRQLLNVGIGAAARIQLTPAVLTGMALTVVGAGIRIACFRTLDRFFTFEVTVKEGHQLCTRGPYSVVRHPSYTGWVLQTVGIALCIFSPGSWAREAGWLHTPTGMVVAGVYTGLQLYTALGMLFRCSKEDALMRKQFGEQWDEWAGRVRYRLVPFIY